MSPEAAKVLWDGFVTHYADHNCEATAMIGTLTPTFARYCHKTG